MPHLLDRFALFYPMRIVGTLFLVLLETLYASQFNGYNAFYFLLVTVALSYPHIVNHIARKYPHNRLQIETRAFLLDSFLLGLVVQSTGFTPLPTLILITVGLVNALAVNGFRQMFLSALALAAGVVLPVLFVGVAFEPRDVVALDIACSVFLFVYFMAFGYSSYNRNALLMRSEAELREQKASLEIEKLRSDRLLLNLIPSTLAAEMQRTGTIKPAPLDSVTLIGVELRGFGRALEAHEPAEVLAHLMHCFKGCDAIAGRHGFEKLKTMGDIYIAAAGLPSATPRDPAAGIEAAREIRQFLGDLNDSRRAQGAFVFDAAVAVHSGPVIGGIVDTAKISYDVWGRTVATLLALLRATAMGEIAISETARRLANDRYRWVRAGEAECGAAAPMVFYTAQAAAE